MLCPLDVSDLSAEELSLLCKLISRINTMLNDKHPDPITCCGEWTWNETERGWESTTPNMDGLTFIHRPSRDPMVAVCAKCHRALLADGKTTGPLVALDTVEYVNETHNPRSCSNPLLYGGADIMLERTWGSTAE